MQDIVKKISESSEIVLFVHENPDGDAIGSITALTNALKKLGKNALGFIEFKPDSYKFLLEDIDYIKEYKELDSEKKYELCISLDCGDVDRTGMAKDIFKNAKSTINIDHHITNSLFGNLNYIDAKASSTGEIIFDLIKKLGAEIDKSIAEALYVSIISDTGMFRHKNTTQRTFEIAGALLGTGIDISLITRKAFYETSLERTKCLAKVLDSLDIYINGKVGIMYIENEDVKKFNIDDQDLEGMVDFARNIRGTEIGIFIKPRGEEYKVSLRSNGKINIVNIAEKFGGGGHIYAAGCKFAGKSIGEVKEILLGELKLLF
jgi:phosphoesterase RecJ-like protein